MIGGKTNIMCWSTAKCAGKVVSEGSTFNVQRSATTSKHEIREGKGRASAQTCQHRYESLVLNRSMPKNFDLAFFCRSLGMHREACARVLSALVC